MPLGLGQEQEDIKTVADTEGERAHGFRAQGTSSCSNNENKSRNMCNLARIGEGNPKEVQQVPFFLLVPLFFPLFLKKKDSFFFLASQEVPLALPRMTSASK